MRIALATDAWTPQTNGVVTTLKATGPLGLAVRRYCPARRVPFTTSYHTPAASAFSWHAATTQFLAGLAPIPLPLRARLAVSRSSAMIGRVAARWQASGAGDAN